MKVLDGPSGRTRWVRPMRPEIVADDGAGPPAGVARPGRRRRPRPDRRLEVRGPGSPSRPVRRSCRSDPSPSAPTSMRSRAATAASSGPGTPTCRRENTPTSGRPGGGAAARTAGRSWPSRSAGRIPTSRAGWATPRASIPRPCMSWRPRRAASRTGSVALGRIGVADLDGDGLADLWGEAEGQLRAFRGEPPEAWRTFGQFSPRGRRMSPGAAAVARPPTSMATGSPIP